MKSLGTAVLCSRCGKRLRGTVGLGAGYHVRRHRDDGTGRGCLGYLFTDHRPAPAK